MDDPVTDMSQEAAARYQAEREQEAATARAKAQALLTVTDPTGYAMLPAEVTIVRDAYIDDDKDPTPWAVRLDYGAFARILPMRAPRAAEAVAMALVACLPGVDYDLTALPDEETP